MSSHDADGDDDGADSSADAGAEARPKKKHLPLWQETLLLLGVALILALIVKTFFVQAFYIPSGSMEPTLIKNDRILVEKVSYWGGDIDRGDVVVFDDPGDWLDNEQSSEPSNVVQKGLELVGLYPSGGHLVKRVIGVGGDKVTYCGGATRVKVNGQLIDEPYLPGGGEGFEIPKASKPDCSTVPVPEGELWVMGDNRANSADSRAHTGGPGGGTISVDEVVGKDWLIVWPWDRIGTVSDHHAFDNDELDELQADVR
ncbi:signal peptidase I [Solicola gregarius]|uniref:Signal peptidase I n=1 Tax=Solicola gregarius TaxID=2908642 RepID=A0AA46TGL1_9ACTN|nr:signal peptidase I [Solicola gregarius]UYM04412.1 signal peptidase I [Solicola gregarius]